MDVRSFCTVNGDWLVTVNSDQPEEDEKRIQDKAPADVDTIIGKGRIHIIARVTRGLNPWDFFKSFCMTLDSVSSNIVTEGMGTPVANRNSPNDETL